MLIGTKRAPESPSIELTPIIDIVFLLLIFFLVATTYRQEALRELKVTLPEAEAAGPISTALREIIISVDQTGAIVVDGRSVDLEGLRSIVTGAIERNPAQKVSVRGDRDAPYGLVARVLDICKAAGVNDPYLDTVPLN